MNNFDLNISNYTVNELITMFNLQSNEFSELDVTDQQTIMMEKIHNDNKMPPTDKKHIRTFIEDVAKTLIESIKKNTNSMLYEDSHQELQKQNTIPYVPSFNSNVYAGTMNPLKRRTMTKNVNIDTRFRQRYQYSISTNFRFELPLILNKVVSIQLKTFEFPAFSFNISDDFGNNYFSINKEIFTVQSGFYSLETLIDALNQTQSYVSFSILSNKRVSIIKTDPKDDFIDFQTEKDIQTPLMLKLGWVLGFREPTYVLTSSIEAEALADMVTLKYCYLCLNDYNNNTVNNTFVGALKECILDQNILARISSPTSITTTIVCPQREYFGPVTITAFQIQLVDPYGRILNLRNLDYSFCLSFELIYDL